MLHSNERHLDVANNPFALQDFIVRQSGGSTNSALLKANRDKAMDGLLDLAKEGNLTEELFNSYMQSDYKVGGKTKTFEEAWKGNQQVLDQISAIRKEIRIKQHDKSVQERRIREGKYISMNESIRDRIYELRDQGQTIDDSQWDELRNSL